MKSINPNQFFFPTTGSEPLLYCMYWCFIYRN